MGKSLIIPINWVAENEKHIGFMTKPKRTDDFFAALRYVETAQKWRHFEPDSGRRITLFQEADTAIQRPKTL